MKLRPIFLLSASLISLLLTACGALAPKPTPTPTPTPVPPTAAAPAATYHFVANKLMIPVTQEQANTFALNIDNDPDNHTDNLFGSLLSLLNTSVPGLEMQKTIDEAVNAGQAITLHSLKTDSASATWSVFLGEPVADAPRFDGTDTFTLLSGAPTNTQINGTFTNGHFAGGPGEVRAQMVILGSSIDVGLIGVRLEADVNEKGCTNGKLGGGITVTEFREKVLPNLANGLNRVVAADKDLGPTILSVFDTDQNGSVSVDELQNNIIIQLATSPDLDLLDASGKFNPRQDGVKDTMSIGLGFTCVTANFDEPEK